MCGTLREPLPPRHQAPSHPNDTAQGGCELMRLCQGLKCRICSGKHKKDMFCKMGDKQVGNSNVSKTFKENRSALHMAFSALKTKKISMFPKLFSYHFLKDLILFCYNAPSIGSVLSTTGSGLKPI